MSTPTMTEKDHFVATLKREHDTTMRLFRDYPKDQLGLRPNARLKSAGDVMWMQVIERGVLKLVATHDVLEPQPIPPAPPTLEAILAAFEGAHADALATLEAMAPSAFNTNITMPVGPKKVAPVRRGDAMWMFLYDSIHHRGQLSVYQRLAGGRVGSIYGPSGDEPWW